MRRKSIASSLNTTIPVILWIVLLLLAVPAFPGLQQVCFVFPAFHELESTEGTLTRYSEAPQYRRGVPLRMVVDGKVLVFACRAIESYRAECLDETSLSKLEGRRIKIWWFSQPSIFFVAKENKVFQLAAEGQVILSYGYLVAKYTDQVKGVVGRVCLMLFISLFVFTTGFYLRKRIEQEGVKKEGAGQEEGVLH